MKATVWLAGFGAAMTLLIGCESVPPGVERGPHGTIAYNVSIQASEPGVRIEANGAYVGTAPMTLKIFGDKDGTFHDFGSYFYVIQALPLRTNQFVQVRVFRTGRRFTPEDYVPRQIFFDMNQPPPANPPPRVPVPAYYPPPYYYYGPGFYFGPPYPYWGGRYYHRW